MGEPQMRAEDGWLQVTPPENPRIRLDARVLDRVFASDDELTLAIGELVVSLRVPAGMAAAAELAAQLVPYVRQPRSGPCVVVGDDPIEAGTAYVRIGSHAYRVGEVRAYALEGAEVPLEVGVVQAALVMIAVHAAERDGTLRTSFPVRGPED